MMTHPAMVNPYASAAKTAEIMSRYRPIAPKPMDAVAAAQGGDSGGSSNGSGMSEKIRQSPYLRKLWPKLQARPTRTRKRGRMIGVAPTAFKRTSSPQTAAADRGLASAKATATFLGLSPSRYYAVNSGFQFHSVASSGGFLPVFSGASMVEMSEMSRPLYTAEKATESLVTLPLLPNSPASSTSASSSSSGTEKGLDLNSAVDEKDLVLQLRRPAAESDSVISTNKNVISPRPVRPVGSCITVTCMDPILNKPSTTTTLEKMEKKVEEVEAEIEAEELPAIVTDSRNRVRLANTAYKELVGQPECLWLESMMARKEGVAGGGRIGGEVVVKTAAKHFTAEWAEGFSGRVKIEWGRSGIDKAVIDACCDVERLSCASKDYVFAWRFRAQPGLA